MDVSVRASAGFVANNSGGTVTISWPAGTVAGDLAVAEIDNAKPAPPGPGWLTVARNVYSKVVTAADLTAGSFQVKSTLYGLVVFAAAARTGRVTWQNGVRIENGGAALFLGWSDSYDNVSVMGSPTGQIGSIVKDYRNAWSSMAVRTGLPAGYAQSTANPPHSISVEIVPTAAPPAPLLSAPAAGQEVQNTAPITLVWAHQGQGLQEAYRVSVRAVGAGSWSYLTSSGTLSGSLQTIAGSAQSATIAASTLTAGTAYEWQVATQENGSFSSYSTTRQFNPQNLPSVSSVTPSVTAGRLAGTVSWAAAATAGTLSAWQLAVTPSAQTAPDSPMWLTPVTAGSSTTTSIPVLDWVNGSSYKAWVRVQQSGGLWSPWTSGTFTVSWTPPAAPTGVAGLDTRPMQANVTGVPAGKDVEAQWSVDGGNAWSPLGYQVAPGTTALFDHPLAPYGVPVSFRARSLEIVDGVGIPSAWAVQSVVTTNLVVNPSFEVNTTSWAGTGCTIATDSASPTMILSGTKNLLATSDGTNTAPTASVTSASYRAAVAAGQWVGFTAFVATETANYQTRLQLSWRDAAGAVISNTSSTYAATPFNTGGNPVVVAQAPAGAVSVAYYAQFRDGNNTGTNVPSGKRMWVENVRIHVEDTQDAVLAKLAEPYFDGSFPAAGQVTYAWSGTAHLSASTKTYPVSTVCTDRGSYFVDDSGAWLPVIVAADGGVEYVQGVQVSYGMGADGARVDRSPVQGARGSLTLDTGTKEAAAALVDWITETQTWTHRRHPETGDNGVDRDAGTIRMSPAKAVKADRPVQALIEDRHVSFDWVER